MSDAADERNSRQPDHADPELQRDEDAEPVNETERRWGVDENPA